MRKQIYHTIAVIGFIISISQPLFADGCFVTNNYGSDVDAPTQKVVISWDGKNQTMILSTKLQSDALADFGWIIPIKSKTKPNVKLGNIQVFRDLSDYFKLPTHRLMLSAGGGELRFDSIQVIERKELGIYDIVILKATDADQLYDWLQLNNFKIESEAKKTFSYYTNSDFYFVTIKIDLLNQYQEDIQQLEKHGLMKHVSHVQVDSKHYALTDYERINRIAPISRKVYEEVRGSISNLARVISELKSGVAKPIEISFAPKEPFFPLKISSVNEGEVTILAYIISKEPLTDRSGILVPHQYQEVTNEMRLKLKKHIEVGFGRKYITKLTFTGKSSTFTRDSYFDEMTIRQKQDLSSENIAFKNDLYHAFLIQNFDLATDLLKNKDHAETSFYEELFLKITKKRPDRYKYPPVDLSYFYSLLYDAEPNSVGQIWSKMKYPDYSQTFNVRMINFLIQKIDDVNVQDKDGKTAIHHLAEIGIYNYYYAIHIMEILLNHNADINTTDKQGKTPLDYIIDHMKRSANDSKAKTGVFMLSKGGVWTQKTDGVLKIISSIEKRLLEEACKSNNVDIARKLLKNYKFEKREMERPFGYALVLGHTEIVKLLIKYGADIDKAHFSFSKFDYRCSTPLCAAIITGQVDIAEYLIRNGANLELTRFSYYEPAIILAYEAGYKKLVKLMINAGADIRRIYRKRETLLVLAARSGDLEIVKLLINKGILLSKEHQEEFHIKVALERQEELAIKAALESGHKEVFEYLKKETGYQKQ